MARCISAYSLRIHIPCASGTMETQNAKRIFANQYQLTSKETLKGAYAKVPILVGDTGGGSGQPGLFTEQPFARSTWAYCSCFDDVSMQTGSCTARWNFFPQPQDSWKTRSISSNMRLQPLTRQTNQGFVVAHQPRAMQNWSHNVGFWKGVRTNGGNFVSASAES